MVHRRGTDRADLTADILAAADNVAKMRASDIVNTQPLSSL